jgi:hypothetical protein
LRVVAVNFFRRHAVAQLLLLDQAMDSRMRGDDEDAVYLMRIYNADLCRLREQFPENAEASQRRHGDLLQAPARVSDDALLLQLDALILRRSAEQQRASVSSLPNN